MKTLPAALILEKNKLSTPNPWLMTLDVTFPDASVIYLVRNTENITFQTRTYLAFPFMPPEIKEDSKGQIQSVQLRMSNVTRILQGYLESQDGAVGAKIILRVVNAAHLTENYAELEMEFEVMEAFSDAEWVTFTLGAPNPMRSNFPQYRYLAGHCNWKFKSYECAYAGAETACARTLDACKALNNSRRFGGFPGLTGGGVRFA